MGYAERTDVPVSRSQAQITDMLRKKGAARIAIGWSEEQAQIAFQHSNRNYRFDVRTVPDHKVTPVQLAQFERVRWRVAHLVIKAKLEAVESGVTTFEQEFLAQMVMPDGSTVYQATRPAIEQAYQSGRSIPLLALE